MCVYILYKGGFFFVIKARWCRLLLHAIKKKKYIKNIYVLTSAILRLIALVAIVLCLAKLSRLQLTIIFTIAKFVLRYAITRPSAPVLAQLAALRTSNNVFVLK